jgi:hypothetical protein
MAKLFGLRFEPSGSKISFEGEIMTTKNEEKS